MKRRNFLYSILAPFLIPLLPKDWRATRNLCRASLERQRAHQHTLECFIGCKGITVNHGHGPGDFDYSNNMIDYSNNMKVLS